MSRSKDYARIKLLHPEHKDVVQPWLGSANGPISFLNPTYLYYTHKAPTSEATSEATSKSNDHEHDEYADEVSYKWSSRNNRKGRHQLEVLAADDPSKAKYVVPESTNAPREIIKNIIRMFTCYRYWDISWLVAYMFVLGSAVWIINAL